jgi:hypothetical protein
MKLQEIARRRRKTHFPCGRAVFALDSFAATLSALRSPWRRTSPPAGRRRRSRRPAARATTRTRASAPAARGAARGTNVTTRARAHAPLHAPLPHPIPPLAASPSSFSTSSTARRMRSRSRSTPSRASRGGKRAPPRARGVLVAAAPLPSCRSRDAACSADAALTTRSSLLSTPSPWIVQARHEADQQPDGPGQDGIQPRGHRPCAAIRFPRKGWGGGSAARRDGDTRCCIGDVGEGLTL